MHFKAVANGNPSGIPKAHLLAAIAANEIKPGISLALFIATGALCHKRGWSGEDYILHCLTVADPLSAHISDDEKIVGLLHDVVEDSDWTFADLRRVGFSAHIVAAVRSVTKQKGEKYFDAVQRASRNRIGRKVKMRDNRHNMDQTRAPLVAGVKQKYLYPVSWMYLRAVDRNEVRAGSSIWAFLAKPEYEKLLTSKNYHYIAQQTSEAPPRDVVAQYGKPDYARKHPKVM